MPARYWAWCGVADLAVPLPVDLAALQATLRQLAADRHWQPFHTPKSLSTALMVEVAELAENFQ